MSNETYVTIRGWAGADPQLYFNERGGSGQRDVVTPELPVSGKSGGESAPATSLDSQRRSGHQASCTMNIGVTARHYDSLREQYVDDETVWYSVRCFGNLARNAAVSVKKGYPVLVRGRLSQREYRTSDGTQHVGNTIVADALGIELNSGVATYVKGGLTSASELSSAHGDETAALDEDELGVPVRQLDGEDPEAQLKDPTQEQDPKQPF